MLLENDLALLSLRAVQLRLVAVADGCGDGVGLQRKCGSVVLCVRSSAITLALHGGLLGRVRGERRMTDESAALSRCPRTHAEKGHQFQRCEVHSDSIEVHIFSPRAF